MRELVSNSIPNGSSSWDQVLEYVASRVIQQKDKSQNITNKKRSVKEVESDLSTNRTMSEVEASLPANRTEVPNQLHKTTDVLLTNNKELPTKSARKPISMAVQRKIHQRDQCCQYQDKQTGNMCSSKWRLTIDHIKPVWAGGSNDPENLRILCRAHNQELYRQQANISQN